MAKKKTVQEDFEGGIDSLFSMVKSIDDSAEIIADSYYSNIQEWVPSGNYILNATMSGDLFKALPSGRIISLVGKSGVGKSYLACSFAREAQHMGYIPIVLDSEGAYDADFVKRIKVDPTKLIIKKVNTILETSQFIANVCNKLEEQQNKTGHHDKVLFILDSLGNLTSEKEREDTRNILNKKVEDMKKALKKQKNPNMEQAKKILDEDKNHIDEIKKEIDIIKKTLLDDYIPVPLYMTVNKSYKKEKINEEIDKNKMVIKLNGISYTKSNPIVIFAIRGENINIHQEIKGKNQEEMYKEFIWEFTEEQFKNLIKYKIEIILARSYTFKSTKAKGKGEIQLRKLKDRSNIDENVKIQMQSGKSDTNMDVEIKLRSPIIDKEYEDDFREIIQIVKIYPKFEFRE